MSLEKITDPSAVRRAIEEFRTIGQPAFLQKYGFGASRGWMIQEGGESYDAKAILGAAHGYQHPSLGPLPQSQFHGGRTTALRLRELGFVVLEPDSPGRNPSWSRDELILALDLYMRHRPSFPDDRHPEVIELSKLLTRLAEINAVAGSDNFRNGNGVAMKLQNFRSFDPAEKGKGLPAVSRGDREVWALYEGDFSSLRATATAIRAAVDAFKENEASQETDDGEGAEEGKILTRLHRIRERNRQIVERRKEKALQEHGALRCEACGFDFSARYGERGSGFIECHHTKPVSTLLPNEKTKLADLTLLCANCHRMIHVRRPWITLAQLKAAVRPIVWGRE